MLINSIIIIITNRIGQQEVLWTTMPETWVTMVYPWSWHRVISNNWMRLSMISKTELNNCFIANFLEAFSYFEHLSWFANLMYNDQNYWICTGKFLFFSQTRDNWPFNTGIEIFWLEMHITSMMWLFIHLTEKDC